jgi:hypothetical protein
MYADVKDIVKEYMYPAKKPEKQDIAPKQKKVKSLEEKVNERVSGVCFDAALEVAWEPVMVRNKGKVMYRVCILMRGGENVDIIAEDKDKSLKVLSLLSSKMIGVS